MEWKEVIENLKYLISEDCTDTQFDYADEIEIAIRVMENQEDLRSKIDKARAEILKNIYKYSGSGNEVTQAYCDGFKDSLEIVIRNMGE